MQKEAEESFKDLFELSLGRNDCTNSRKSRC